MQRSVLVSPLLLLGMLFSIVALIFALIALASLYFEDPSADAIYAWGPFAVVCGFLALGALGAERATGNREAAYWQQPLALIVGGVLLLLALITGIIGVAMAPAEEQDTFFHGVGWLAFAQGAAILGAAWLIFAPPKPE